MQSYAKSLATILLRSSKDFVMKFILLKKEQDVFYGLFQ